MAVLPLATTIPIPTTAFLTPEGNVSRPWLYFMLAIFNRTGGSAGISSFGLEKQLLGVQIQEAMDDDVDARPRVGMSLADVMSDDAGVRPSVGITLSDVLGDDVQPVNRAMPVLLTLSLMDDVPRAQLNPFLASLLVADAV